MYNGDSIKQPEANLDVDQFGMYRKINFAYADDDFVYQQKADPLQNYNQNPSGAKEEKKYSKSQIHQEDPNAFFRIEPKDKTNCKAQISHLDWAIDGRLICASFKIENVAVVWNISTCKKVYEFKASDHDFGNINKALFYNLNPDYLQISGDKALIMQLSTKKQIIVSESTPMN